MGTGKKPSQVCGRSVRTAPVCAATLMCTDYIWTGFLYKDFASQADYEYVLAYAKQIGVILWENAVKRAFFGTLEGHSNIRAFIERRTGGG